MNTTATKATWMSKDGELVCDKHGGQYLASAIAKSPKKFRHVTPITTWHRVTDEHHEMWNVDFGTDCICEHCE